MDMGIIAATKLHYRRRSFSVRVSTMAVVNTLRAQAKERKMAAGTGELAEDHAVHVLDAAELLDAAWGISKDAIARCLFSRINVMFCVQVCDFT